MMWSRQLFFCARYKFINIWKSYKVNVLAWENNYIEFILFTVIFQTFLYIWSKLLFSLKIHLKFIILIPFNKKNSLFSPLLCCPVRPAGWAQNTLIVSLAEKYRYAPFLKNGVWIWHLTTSDGEALVLEIWRV